MDAQLQPAGSISGTVTSAVTGRPMEEVLICALTKQLAAADCTESGAGGEYHLKGLAPGEWIVGFNAGPGYQVQYYEAAVEPAGAKILALAPGAALTGIDATINTRPVKPVPVPVPLPTMTLTPPAPATSTTPASGVLGATFVMSVPSMVLADSRVSATGRVAGLQVTCRSAPCSGSAALTLRVTVMRRSHGRLARHTETIVLGRGSFSLATGAHGVIRVHLTSAGVKRLADARRRPVNATLSISIGGGASLVRAVRIA